jgi:peptidoglycan/LPS O-acetylase OafA/YrhL
MFGSYRLFLAALVALSHFGVIVAGFNPGQWAVISFYTLSGLLMERQYKKLSSSQPGVTAFYLDRFLRIYPLFLAIVLLTLIVSPLSLHNLLLNVTLLPLNYHELLNVPLLITPAWSLACEAHFYLLVPLLVMCPTKTLKGLLYASLAFFAASPFLPLSTFWAYTALPGILFTFLTGILINRGELKFIRIIWLIMFVLLLGFGVSKYAHTGLPTGIHINVCIGYLIAAAVVPFLDRFDPRIKWDKALGLFSYPLFLCHSLVLAIAGTRTHNPIALLAGSMMFAAILIILIELPFDRIRYQIRPAKPANL